MTYTSLHEQCRTNYISYMSTEGCTTYFSCTSAVLQDLHLLYASSAARFIFLYTRQCCTIYISVNQQCCTTYSIYSVRQQYCTTYISCTPAVLHHYYLLYVSSAADFNCRYTKSAVRLISPVRQQIAQLIYPVRCTTYIFILYTSSAALVISPIRQQTA
jgi:hypothetical protein